MNIGGCTMTKLEQHEPEACLAWVAGLSTEKPDVLKNQNLQYLLAQSVSGVTWGYWSEAGKSWCTSDKAFPDLCPALDKKSLLELRIFGDTAEVHIWNTENGLQGRIATDQMPDSGLPEYLKPADIEFLLEGEKVVAENKGFTRVRGQTGKEQALPLKLREPQLSMSPVLLARQYFEQDQSSGVVRPVLTRLKGFRLK